VTYRAELSDRALEQLGDFPAKAFDALIATMSAVVEYPDDPIRTFPTSDPYVRRAEFGGVGLVTYVIDDGRRTVTLTDVTWTG
jgi:mRNA-degrading endonuclease RelE of RelBE toxin-antitoxin system